MTFAYQDRDFTEHVRFPEQESEPAMQLSCNIESNYSLIILALCFVSVLLMKIDAISSHGQYVWKFRELTMQRIRGVSYW